MPINMSIEYPKMEKENQELRYQNRCLLEAFKESYLELECIKIKSTATIRAHRIIKEAISKANQTI